MDSTGQPDSRPANQPVDRPAYMDSTEAAGALGISLDALRKRIARGTIEAIKEAGHWYVRCPDGQPATDRPGNRPPDQNQDGAMAIARIESLEAQLAIKDTQIDQLHHLLAQTALNQVPARPWWRFW